jgi:hypothetical protein
VTAARIGEIAEFAMLAAKALGRVVGLDASHVLDPARDAATVLFKAIIQLSAGLVRHRPLQHRAGRS